MAWLLSRSSLALAVAVSSLSVLLVQAGMEVDLYVHKDKFGKSLTLDISHNECTNVPRLWANLSQSVDTHGSCVQFYDRKNCKGRIAVIQPFHTVHQMDLSLIQFHNTIESLSPCGPKVPSGRYVIQSAVDASMLTVQKSGNEFARVNTLPPQAFIPKAQQWEISEKQPNEYDIMPRIHETNAPVTYDGDSMKKGNFIRKVWKIESVGRGRYIIKSEWTQKCLYKTRIRTVEEHDCRAWSPNQEWVLRPLIAPTAAPATQAPQVAADIGLQVPSRVVEKYLEEQKKKTTDKDAEESDHVGAYLQPYRIRNKSKVNKNKKNKKKQNKDESSEEDLDLDQARQNIPQVAPPGPEIMYSRPSYINPYSPQPPLFGRAPSKILSYINGVSPIFQDYKADDPTFPDFLLHAASANDGVQDGRYIVTRRPFQPAPEGHPDYIPDRKKYDGRDKGPAYEPLKAPQDESQFTPEQDEQNSEESSDEQNETETEDASQESEEKKNDKEKDDGPGPLPIAQTKVKGQGSKHDEQEPKLRDDDDEEQSEEENEDEAEDSEDKPKKASANDQESEEEKNKNVLDEDDPAADVASFMSLLFKGINNRISKTKPTTTVEELLIR